MRSFLVASLLLASTAAHASVDQKVRCANAYEQAQRTRNEGQLLASRAHLLVCTEESCPAVLRTECIKWLGEVDQAMPTVLIVADVGGAETAEVTVSVDGTKVLDRLDGKAIPVDPGAHTFRFVHPGSVPVEQKVLVREGEKRRPVAVSFPAPPPPKAEPPTTAASSSAPTATWVLGGIGIAALGVSIPFYVSAYGQRSTLDSDPCASAGTCDPDRVSTVKRRFVVADVVAGVGLSALGGAVIVWLATPTASASITPVPGGVANSFAITF